MSTIPASHPLSRVIGVFCLATGLALTLTACKDAPPETPAADSKPADPMLVRVAPEQAANYKTSAVVVADVALVQEHPGRVEANERQVARIGATVTGRVTQVQAELGDIVRPGQVLARVSSPELTTAQLGYLRAQSNLPKRRGGSNVPARWSRRT